MKRMKKILSLLLVVMMVISLLPTEALADSLKHELTSEAETVSEGETEKKDTASVLTELVFSVGNVKDYQWTLTPEFNPNVTEYTLIVPTNYENPLAWITFSDKYPNATAVATYQKYGATSKLTKNLQAGTGTKLVNAVRKGTLSNTFTITVKSNDENDITEVYNFKVIREERPADLKFYDKDGTEYNVPLTRAETWSHKLPDVSIPETGVFTISAKGQLDDSVVTVSDTVDGVFTPKWKDGICEYTVTVTPKEESILPVTYKGRFLSKSAYGLRITTPPTKTAYEFGEKFDSTGMIVELLTEGNAEVVDLSSTDVTIEPNRPLNENDKYISIIYKGNTVKQVITVSAYDFKGEGTKEKPYLLENADDCVALSKAVSAGKTYADTYFKITNNITLPEGWVPIGSLLEGEEYDPSLGSAFYSCFSGHIDGANPDGGNYLLTIPSGEKTLLGCVIDGSLSNLDIYGERIDGYGVMEYYVVGRQYGVPAIDITNVNLKSGTHTKMSGFLGGYASGSNTVNITDCTIEEGVVIGDDGSWGDELDKTYGYGFVSSVQYNDMVGSFGGAFNGNIVNCVSYATVYGHNYVGGLIGFKGQSMGDCMVENCEFAGKVIATGDYAGGIIGSGYSADSAPNTPCVTVQNCLVSGSVTGNDKVGGILGGNQKTVDCWNNGIGYLRGNLVTGTVTAKAENAVVGGIVGYINAVNKYNIIKNNYYVEGIADKGIGEITVINKDNVYCDTQAISKADLTNGKAVELLNSAKAGINPWKQGTDSPVFNEGNRIYKVKLSVLNGMLATVFQSNDGYNSYITKGGDLTAYYKDGSTVTVPVVDGVTIGPDFNVTETQSTQLCSVMYDGYEHFFGITIVKQNQALKEQQMKAVKLNIFGDTVHEVTDDNFHSFADGNLMEWFEKTVIMVPQDATALDVIKKAADAYGISYQLGDSQYGKILESMSMNGVTLDNECNKQTDGKAYCGWKFNVNGKLMSTGLDKTTVKDGDTLTVYFEDDIRMSANNPEVVPGEGTTTGNGVNNGSDSQGSAIKTGDNSLIFLWTGIAVTAFTVAALTIRRKREERF